MSLSSIDVDAAVPTPTGVDEIDRVAAALGALSRAGILNPLPDDVLERVPARFRSEADDWVGLSGRARVVVYNTDATSVDELPHSLADASAPRFRGRFGLAPTNASFQAHMAMYRALHGEDSLTALLHGIADNEPRLFDGNSAIVRAVAAGEIDWGLVNHYYLWRLVKEDPSITAANHFQPDSGSNFVNMAGAGIVSEHPGARKLLRYLVSEPAQRYFSDETFEYPLVPGMAASVNLPALEQIDTPTLGYRAVAESLEPALEQIRQSGLTGFR